MCIVDSTINSLPQHTPSTTWTSLIWKFLTFLLCGRESSKHGNIDMNQNSFLDQTQKKLLNTLYTCTYSMGWN